MTVSFTSSYITPLWRGTRSVADAYGHFVFGTHNEKFAELLKESVSRSNGGFSGLGHKIAEAYRGAATSTTEGFFRSTWNSMKSIPGDIGKEMAETGAFKGLFKGLGKKMPLIGNLLMIAFEAPNIYRAFKDGGVGAGFKELGKSAAKLGAFAAGAALGQALIPIPFVGGLIGGIAGGWIADKLLGKSFTEKKEEAEKVHKGGEAENNEQAAVEETEEPKKRVRQEHNAQQPVAPNPFVQNPYIANPYMQNPYQAQYGMNNPFANQGYMDQDFMKLSSGLG